MTLAQHEFGKTVEKKFYYSEIFHSIQGEGHYTGVPTAWIRFFLCNLQCNGFGQIDPTNPDTYDLLEKNHKDIIEHKFNIIDKLASKKSWANFFGPNGIQPQQMESLKAWAKLITALGKGKGKHAARKTKAAKDKMKEMQESIPCWVMPLYRVVENFTLTNIFDLLSS